MRNKRYRLFITIPILFILTFAASTQTFAKDEQVIVVDSGKLVKLKPKLFNGETYVPLRTVLQSLGWKLSWNGTERTVTCVKAENKIFLKIGNVNGSINNRPVVLDRPPLLFNGLTYVQNRFIAQQFGVNVVWNRKDNLIIVSKDCKSDISINGGQNIVIAGNGMIINIVEPYSSDILSDMLDYADRLLSGNNPADALMKYKEILNHLSKEENPEIYAHLMNNMGNAYSVLADVKDTKTNTLLAVEAYGKALEVYQKSNTTFNYYITLNNLANAHRVLGKISSDNTLLNTAITLYKEALSAYSPDLYILDHAMIQYNMGMVYHELGDSLSSKASLTGAKATYHQALAIYTPDKEPALCAFIQYNLGNIYKLSSETRNRKIFLEKAETTYKQALKVWTVESHPLNYAKIQYSLGDIYVNLYVIGNIGKNIEQAIQCYDEASAIYTAVEYPVDSQEILRKKKYAETLLESLKGKKT